MRQNLKRKRKKEPTVIRVYRYGQCALDNGVSSQSRRYRTAVAIDQLCPATDPSSGRRSGRFGRLWRTQTPPHMGFPPLASSSSLSLCQRKRKKKKKKEKKEKRKATSFNIHHILRKKEINKKEEKSRMLSTRQQLPRLPRPRGPDRRVRRGGGEVEATPAARPRGCAARRSRSCAAASRGAKSRSAGAGREGVRVSL